MKKETILQVAGPIFILSTLALAEVTFVSFFVAALGLFLSLSFPSKGLFYGLGVLVLGAIWELAFLTTDDFLWHLGLFCSYAIAFFITSEAKVQSLQKEEALHSQWEALKTSLQHREEEISQLQVQNAEQQIAYQNKQEEAQKQLEESAIEYSSISMLNEVLRKTAEKHREEREILEGDFQAIQVRLASLMEHSHALESELEKLRNESGVVLENQRLTEALQKAQLDKEQTHLINETLARLHAKETLKSQVMGEQLSSLEIAKQELLSKVEAGQKDLNQEKECVAAALLEKETILAQKSAIEKECESLKEQLASAEKRPLIDPAEYVAKSEVAPLEQRVKALTEIEILYKQLKRQFEEKNKVLHETRKTLFHISTELETSKIEKERHEEMGLVSLSEIVQELSTLEEQRALLEEENAVLERIVTALSPLPKKQKISKKDLLQTSLFASDITV